MKKEALVVLLLLLGALPSFMQAQDCDIYTLTMPEDTTICEAGAPVTLTPVFTGNANTISWTPAGSLDFATLINPTASPDTTTTYELTIQAVAPENLIFNGDFSMGDVGFFTDYVYGNGGQYGTVSDEGDYAIDDNANDTHDNFAACEDHTGGGNMMVVNGSGQPDNVWCQNVEVQPNTLYSFSAWVTTVISENPANLQFSINGILLGDQFDATINSCVWQQFAEAWFSGSNTSAQICVVNVNEETSGNDFALDDIAFSPVCTYTGTVTVIVDEVPAAPVVSCEATTSSITLEWEEVPDAETYEVNVLNAPEGGFEGNTSYQLEGLDPGQTVDFEVIAYGPGGCSSITAVSCTTEECPELDITLDAPATICEGQEVVLQVSINGAAGPFQLTISDGQNELSFNDVPSGNSTYSFSPEGDVNFELTALAIVDAANCIVENLPAPVAVLVNEQPEAGTAADTEICSGRDSLIELFGLLEMADEGGQWADISAISAGTAFDPATGTINISNIEAGNYLFEYAIPATAGCEAVSTTAAVVIHPSPLADAGQDATLDCSTLMLGLGGENTSLADSLSYKWSNLSGDPVMEDTSPFTSTDAPGIYELLVIENTNGCSDTDTVVIDEAITVPILFASSLSGLCDSELGGSIQVDSVENGQPPYQFSLNGAELTDNQLFTGLSAGGYTLDVFDANGCQGTVVLNVQQSETLEAELTANGNNSIYTGDSVLLQLLVNRPAEEIVSIEWMPAPANCNNCTQASFAPQSSQVYQVEVEDINGCSVTTDIFIRVEQRSRYFIPNAFSPNEDGRNDTFYLFAASEFKEVAQLIIMDRWGNMVFRQERFPANDPAFAWDGTFKGEPMPAGVYAFAATLVYQNGEELKVSGSLNLVR